MEVRTTLTAQGYRTLMSEGLEDTIVYYQIGDIGHNYLVTAGENFVPQVVGSHKAITTSHCAFADYNGIFTVKPTTSEIQNLTSKVQFNFVNEECSYGNFNKPNLSVEVNLNPWLQQLGAAVYDFNMSESLVLDIWDYITATIQTFNLSTQTYDNKKFLTNLNLSYKPNAETDRLNMTRLSPRYVQLEGTKRIMVDNSEIRFGSPLNLLFSTYSVNGNPINGAACKLSLAPFRWGYLVNGINFISTIDLEDSDLRTYETISPAAIVGNNTYYLPDANNYQTKNKLIGYASKMVKTDGTGETLLTGLINQTILFMKTYGVKIGATKYIVPINLQVIATNPEINYIQNKSGGQVNLTIIFDETDLTSPIINVLS